MSKTKKIDKEELKNPDLFISTSEKIFKHIEHNLKPILSVVGAVLVVSIGYVGYGYVQTAKENSAAEALYKPEAELQKAQASFAEKKPETSTDKTKKAEPPAPANYAKDYAPIVGRIKAQIGAHSGAKASLISALNLSFFLIQQKQYAEALETLNLVKFQPVESDDLFGFWQMNRGVALIENNQLDSAVDAYQKVLNSPNLSPFFPEAILKQGLCFELKGDLGRARANYERLGREFPRTEASSTAEQYLRLLDLKKQG